MNPSPVWQENARRLSDSETERVVTAAAIQLKSALQAAAATTESWSDQPLAYALVETAMTECLLPLSSTGWWGRDNQLPSTLLWRIAGEMLETGWLQRRAREKPLGYAGDYELLSAIIHRDCCPDPLGRHFDRFFLNQAAPTAVRNRTEMVAHRLAVGCLAHRADDYEVVSVGCGPAWDIRRGIEILPVALRSRVRTTLLDLDSQSLDFAKQNVLSVADPDRLSCFRENLFRLARRPDSDRLIGRPQLLVCTGLFDYLEDDVAHALLQWFWDRLATGGQLLIGNFAPDHATRAYMEWIGNWYLTYRTSQQLERMAESVGIPVSCRTIGAEATGADLFLQAVKQTT